MGFLSSEPNLQHISREVLSMYLQQVHHDGVSYVEYSDRSHSLKLLRRDRESPHGGCNERLEEGKALAKSKGKDPGSFSYGDVTVSSTATTLGFERHPGISWGGGSGYNGERLCTTGSYYFKLYSDLQRSHLPQSWARGFMPLFSNERFRAWERAALRGDPDAREILEFNMPLDQTDMIEVASIYVRCIMSAWSDIHSTTAMRDILIENGMDVALSDVRRIFKCLMDEGSLAPSARRGKNDEVLWRPTWEGPDLLPTIRGFSRGGPEQLPALFQELADLCEVLERYAKVQL